MPQRVNSLSDIGTAKVASDSYDIDNIFLTDQGWVYRHYKMHDESQYWDEIIVAGEVDPAATVDGVANTPVAVTTYSTTGGGSEEWAPAGYETGDLLVDLEYGGGDDGEGPTGDGATVVEGPDRYTAYEQYPPFADAPDAPDAPDGGDGGGTGDSGDAPADVLLELTGADGTNSYTSAGGANASVSIQAGGTLTITNNSGGHPVTVRVADEGATVSTGTLSGAPAGDGESLTWDTTGVTPGTYYYQCTVHPTMIGEITVTA